MLCKAPFGDFGCGQCIPCRINSRRIWTHRIMLEAGLHGDNGFLTLTYDDEHLPQGGTLVPKDAQDFLKRFRERISPEKVRFFLVGEYGDQTNRPHYHAALFGFGCAGKLQRPETGIRCYCERCELVRQAWGQGNIAVDELNDTTAAYIGGYVLKKMTSPDDFRLAGRHPEFMRSSRRPGVGADAVLPVADALRSEYGHFAFKHGDVPRALSSGRSSSRPLGRFLLSKLRKELGLEKINPCTGEVTYGTPSQTIQEFQKEAEPEMCAVQDAIRLASFEEAKGHLYQELDTLKARKVSKRRQRVLQLETKHAIYSSGKVKKL